MWRGACTPWTVFRVLLAATWDLGEGVFRPSPLTAARSLRRIGADVVVLSGGRIDAASQLARDAEYSYTDDGASHAGSGPPIVLSRWPLHRPQRLRLLSGAVTGVLVASPAGSVALVASQQLAAPDADLGEGDQLMRLLARGRFGLLAGNLGMDPNDNWWPAPQLGAVATGGWGSWQRSAATSRARGLLLYRMWDRGGGSYPAPGGGTIHWVRAAACR